MLVYHLGYSWGCTVLPLCTHLAHPCVGGWGGVGRVLAWSPIYTLWYKSVLYQRYVHPQQVSLAGGAHNSGITRCFLRFGRSRRFVVVLLSEWTTFLKHKTSSPAIKAVSSPCWQTARSQHSPPAKEFVQDRSFTSKYSTACTEVAHK